MEKENVATSSTSSRSVKALIVCIVAAAALIAADLVSKSWALGALSEPAMAPPDVCEVDEEGNLMGMQRRPTEPMEIIPELLEMRYAENCGAAFGLMNNQPPEIRKIVFGVAAIAATLVLLWMFYRGRGGRYFALAVPFIVAGALGNFYDRLTLGYVVDFVRIHWEGTWLQDVTGWDSWPTFNVADVAITLGVVFLLIDQIQDWKRERAERRAESAKDQAE